MTESTVENDVKLQVILPSDFSKEDNFCGFLFASLDDETLFNRDLLLNVSIPTGANSFLP